MYSKIHVLSIRILSMWIRIRTLGRQNYPGPTYEKNVNPDPVLDENAGLGIFRHVKFMIFSKNVFNCEIRNF